MAGCNTSSNHTSNQKSEVFIDDYVLFVAKDGLSRSPSFVISDNNFVHNQTEVWCMENQSVNQADEYLMVSFLDFNCIISIKII